VGQAVEQREAVALVAGDQLPRTRSARGSPRGTANPRSRQCGPKLATLLLQPTSPDATCAADVGLVPLRYIAGRQRDAELVVPHRFEGTPRCRAHRTPVRSCVTRGTHPRRTRESGCQVGPSSIRFFPPRTGSAGEPTGVPSRSVTDVPMPKRLALVATAGLERIGPVDTSSLHMRSETCMIRASHGTSSSNSARAASLSPSPCGSFPPTICGTAAPSLRLHGGGETRSGSTRSLVGMLREAERQ
jgi:hypothetical protein